MSKLIRASWPRIRYPVTVKGCTYYMVDSRKQGTNGKREYHLTRRAAEERASELAQNLGKEGKEGFAVNYRYRSVILDAEKRLAPFGKSLEDAIDHYVEFLDKQSRIQASERVQDLAFKWYQDKSTNKNKVLRFRTLKSIKDAYQILGSQFRDQRIGELTKEDFEGYFDSLKVGNRRKFNLKSLFSQFFNWCQKKRYTTYNPLADIEIVPEHKEVEIYTIEQIERFHTVLSEQKFSPLVPYIAICLYAGLRPDETIRLDWKSVHLTERQITVWAKTSKTKETRNVHIEDKLLALLDSWKGKKLGPIATFGRPLMDDFKKALGFRWLPDGLRHTYASYWLAKYHDRPKLAEQMGNSLKMIKNHYKQIVRASDVEKFWA